MYCYTLPKMNPTMKMFLEVSGCSFMSWKLFRRELPKWSFRILWIVFEDRVWLANTGKLKTSRLTGFKLYVPVFEKWDSPFFSSAIFLNIWKTHSLTSTDEILENVSVEIICFAIVIKHINASSFDLSYIQCRKLNCVKWTTASNLTLAWWFLKLKSM